MLLIFRSSLRGSMAFLDNEWWSRKLKVAEIISKFWEKKSLKMNEVEDEVLAGLILDAMKVKESLNVTFDETPPPSKTSPLVDDDLDEEEAIKVTKKKNLENDIMDETLEVDEIVNIKESRPPIEMS
ncbi:hypothetical protein Tco_0343667 [Tanacetum coccineum]